MLIKAASQLRPLIRLPSFTSSTTSVPPPTTFTPTSASSPSVGGGSFTSNVHLLQSTTPGAGSLIAPGIGTGNLGSAAGSAPGGGWSGGRSNFNGYTGFGRILTQTPSHSPHSALTSQQSAQDELERDANTSSNAVAIRRLKGERPGLKVVQLGGDSGRARIATGVPGLEGRDVVPPRLVPARSSLGTGQTRIGGSGNAGPRFRIVDVDVGAGVTSVQGAEIEGISRQKRVLRSTPEADQPLAEISSGSRAITEGSPASSATPPLSSTITPTAPLAESDQSISSDLDMELEIEHPSSIPLRKHRYVAQSAADNMAHPSWRAGAIAGVRMTRTGSQVGRKRSSVSTPEMARPVSQVRSVSTSAPVPQRAGPASSSRLPAVSSPLATHVPVSAAPLDKVRGSRKRSKSTSAAEVQSPITDDAGTLLSMTQRPPSPSPLYTAPIAPEPTEMDVATEAIRETLEESDRRAYTQIVRAVAENDRDRAKRLIQRYRNPLSITNPALAAQSASTPPPYFTQSTYNAVLMALNKFRKPGQPISEILAVYNELLERDVLPNVRTYSEVITALLARDEEIKVAEKHSAKQKTWLEWDREAGICSERDYSTRVSSWERHAASIATLAKERNFEIAAKLFNSAVPYNRHRAFSVDAYRGLMEGAAARGEVETAVQVWTQLEGCVRTFEKADKRVMIPLQAFEGLIMTYGKSGQVAAIGELLEEYLKYEKRRLVIAGRMTEEELAEVSESELPAADPAIRAKGARQVFATAVRAYITNGDIDKAQELLEKMSTAPAECSGIPGTIPPVTSSVYGEIAVAALNAGDSDYAIESIRKFLEHAARVGTEASEVRAVSKDLMDASLLARNAQALFLSVQGLGGDIAFSSERSEIFNARIVRCLSVMVPHAEHAVSEGAGKVLLRGIVDFITKNGGASGSQAVSRYASSLVTLAKRYNDEASAEAFAKYIKDTETEAVGNESVASETGSMTNTVDGSTAATSTNDDHRHLDMQFTEHLSRALGPNPRLQVTAACALIMSEAAKGVFALPDVVGEVAQMLSRLPNTEPQVRELHRIALDSLDICQPALRRRSWIRVHDEILMACCHMGYLEEAGMYRARIIEQGAAPSADAYATMIASAKDTTDDASVARELWTESQRLEVTPNLYLYNTIISKLSRARKAESAIELFMEMRSKNIRPSSVTYGAVINACSRVGDVESATTLFTEMQAMPNFRPRVPPYNTMMQLHLQTHPKRNLVLHYYNQLIQAGVQPSAHTYKLLLDAYGSLQPLELDAMEVVFANLCADAKVEVQGTHWASIIYAYGRSAGDLTKALEVFESIPNHPSTRAKQNKGIEPVVWEAIISVAGQHKAIEKLDELAGRMKSSGARPTAYVNNMLIKGYAAAGEIDKARAVFESMADGMTGVAAPNNHPTLHTSSGQAKPTTTAATSIVFREPSSYEAMIRAELSVGNREGARALCERLEARSYPRAVTSRIRGILSEV